MKNLFVLIGFVLVGIISYTRACDDTFGTVINGIGRECREWAGTGGCDKNPRFMNKNCQRTCNKCNVDVDRCMDHHSNITQCEEYARQDHCKYNPRLMKLNCQKTCKACSDQIDGCVDHYGAVSTYGISVECNKMAKQGDCNSNLAEWMQTNCQASCYTCTSNHFEACNDSPGGATCNVLKQQGACDADSFLHQPTKNVCRKTCKLCDQPPECNGDTAPSSNPCDYNGDQDMKDFICIRRAVECCQTCKDWRNNNKREAVDYKREILNAMQTRQKIIF